MARELEVDIPYKQVMSISRRIEGMHAKEQEEREAKRSRETGHYCGTRTSAAGRRGRGYMGRPVHSALSSSNSTPAPPISQKPYYAPMVFSAPVARGASKGQSSRVMPSQSQPLVLPELVLSAGLSDKMIKITNRLNKE